MSSTLWKEDWYVSPRWSGHFHRPQAAVMCVTGRQVLPPSSSSSTLPPSGTPEPEELVSHCIGFSAAQRSTVNYELHRTSLDVSTWRLETDRRISVDHSKLVLVPVDHQPKSSVDDGLRSTCSCDRRGRFERGSDRKRCRRCTRAPTIDALRLDDERRGRYRTLFLGSEFVSPARPLMVTARPTGTESTTTRSIAGTTSSSVAEGSPTGRRRSDRSRHRDKVVRLDGDGGAISGESSAEKCDECERLLAERFGSFDRFIELINSGKIPADWSWLPDHDCVVRRKLGERPLVDGIDASRAHSGRQVAGSSHRVDDNDTDEKTKKRSANNKTRVKTAKKSSDTKTRKKVTSKSTDNGSVKPTQEDSVTADDNLQKQTAHGDVSNVTSPESGIKSALNASEDEDGDGGSMQRGTVDVEGSVELRRAAISEVDRSLSAAKHRSTKPKRERDSAKAARRVGGRSREEEEEDEIEEQSGVVDDEQSDDETIEWETNDEEVPPQVIAEAPPLPEVPLTSPASHRPLSSLSLVNSEGRRNVMNLSSSLRLQRQETRSVTESQFGYYVFPPLHDELSRKIESGVIHREVAQQTLAAQSTRHHAKLNIGRFELPTDVTLLKDMVPADYLRHHCRLATDECEVYGMIYKRHCNRLTSKLHADELRRALRDVIPADVTPGDVNRLCSVAGVQPIGGVDDGLFVGLVALAARMLQPGNGHSGTKPSKSPSTSAVSTYDEALHRSPSHIELTDMSSLRRKLEGVDVNPSIRRLIDIVTPE